MWKSRDLISTKARDCPCTDAGKRAKFDFQFDECRNFTANWLLQCNHFVGRVAHGNQEKPIQSMAWEHLENEWSKSITWSCHQSWCDSKQTINFRQIPILSNCCYSEAMRVRVENDLEFARLDHVSSSFPRVCATCEREMQSSMCKITSWAAASFFTFSIWKFENEFHFRAALPMYALIFSSVILRHNREHRKQRENG